MPDTRTRRLDRPRRGRSAAETDVAIVGLGGIGSATALFAARGGQRVLGLERFELGGHHRGASHDHSRIIRRSYHTEHYVRLTAGAYDAWREVEVLSGEQCVWVTGGVDLFPPGAAIDATTYTSAMHAAGVPFDVVAGAEVRRRWPAIAVDDDVVGLVQAETGLVSPARAVPLLQRLAGGLGADLRGGCVVRELRPADDHVELIVEGLDRPVLAGTVVVAADAWTNELLRGLDADLPLTVLQEQVTYYDVAEPEPFEMGRLPVWIWMDEPSFYGFPLFGRAGVKIAQDCGGTEVTTRTRRLRARHRHPRPHGRLRPSVLRRSAGCGRAHHDLPLHAHPRSRLRPRPGAWASPCPGGPRSCARLQVRGLVRADPGRAGGGCARPGGPGPVRLRPACAPAADRGDELAGVSRGAPLGSPDDRRRGRGPGP